MKVYIVFLGVTEIEIKGVFSTEARATAFVGKMDYFEKLHAYIEPYTVDKKGEVDHD